VILHGLVTKLATLDVEAIAERAAAIEAKDIAEALPLERGEVRAGQGRVEIGWRSAALRRREQGDVGVPPRPGVAAVMAARGERAAEAIGKAVADALREG
jgi:hypothetical protein